ncbi:MAG: branched-chain amino acid ABC transporter permease [Candidatus Norongarragalinales archaeon]
MIDVIVNGIIPGIILGGLYALMSCGLTLIWGTVGILNFAHGAFITFSGYLAWLFLNSLNINFAVVMCLAVLFTFILGVIAELSIFRPLRGRTNVEMNSIYASLGMAMIIENLILLVFGPRRKVIPPVADGSIVVGEVTITLHKLAIISIALFSLAIFSLFLKKSRVGIAMRAVAQNMLEAKAMGINTNRIYLLTIGLGSALAGVAGILLGSFYYLWPTFGDIPLIKAFVIIVFGGLGNVRGTMYASFILGIVESIAALFLGSGWAIPTMFMFMILALLFKPSGVFGRE